MKQKIRELDYGNKLKNYEKQFMHSKALKRKKRKKVKRNEKKDSKIERQRRKEVPRVVGGWNNHN